MATEVHTEVLNEDPVLREIVEHLVRAYEPESVYLFGSKARGDYGPDSDYDLLLIVPDDAPPERRRSRLAYETLWAMGPRDAVDVLVCTRSYFDARRHLKASLPGTVLREGKVLYATRPRAHRRNKSVAAEGKRRSPDREAASGGMRSSGCKLEHGKMDTQVRREILNEDPVLREIVRRLAEAYEPLQIYLFGSKARGDAGPDSDYDLLVVVADEAPPELRKSKLAYEKLWGGSAPADVLVCTDSWFHSRARVVTSLPATVLREGKLLYAA
jgi:uncharacterized protein